MSVKKRKNVDKILQYFGTFFPVENGCVVNCKKTQEFGECLGNKSMENKLDNPLHCIAYT